MKWKHSLYFSAAWLLGFSLVCFAPHCLLGDERSECRRLAPKYNAEVEVVMPDGTRCDLLNDTHAIEADWGHKWPEAIGQSTLYSLWTGKKPAVLLLVKDFRKEKLHILRCKLVCERLNITLFIEGAKDD